MSVSDRGPHSARLPGVPRFPRPSRRRRAMRVLLVVGIVLAVVVALLAVGVGLLTGSFHHNAAKAAAAPLIAVVKQTGATTLCSDGNSGYGADNTQPWQMEYLRVSDPAKAEAALIAEARSRGFDLVVDHAHEPLPAGEHWLTSNPKDTDGTDDTRREVTVVVDTRGQVALDCTGWNVTWGQTVDVPPGGAIYQLSVTDPTRTL